ncbi:MAG: hypothetical protein WAO98_10270 [Alphaproteobacteria bacterium]
MATRSHFQRYLSFSAVTDAAIIIPVVAIIIMATVITAASVLENIRFARATDQILSLVGTARDYTVHEKNFGLEVNEDLIASLIRNGQLPQIPIINPWKEEVKARITSPSVMRLEITVPVHECRRLAFFFLKDAVALRLKLMEAREGNSGVLRRFYDSSLPVLADPKPVEAGCGETPQATLLLSFNLR